MELPGVPLLETAILGEPVPKARARVFTDRRGYTRSVTPEKTREAEKEIGWRVKAMWRRDPDSDSSFLIIIYFYLSLHKNGKVRRVDLDNLLKTVLDACNGIVWKDDSQVVGIYARRYNAVSREPGINIEIRKL